MDINMWCKLLFNYRRNVLCVIKPAGNDSDDPKVNSMALLTHSRAWQGSTQMGGGEGEGEGEGEGVHTDIITVT